MEAKINVLDHGFVRLVEVWGKGDAGEPEAGIIEAARQSTQGSFRGWELDEKLLRFLYCNDPKHATPFEFAGMVIEVQAPIFVFREWHRHRTQSYNEMSARYAPLPELDYLPLPEHIHERAVSAASTKNKQARGAVLKVPSLSEVETWRARLKHMYGMIQELYADGLEMGVPKEVSRITLAVGRYSRMRASACLRNWLAFLTLRMDPGAQLEIRMFACAVGVLVAQHFPRTYKLFDQEYQSKHLS